MASLLFQSTEANCMVEVRNQFLTMSNKHCSEENYCHSDLYCYDYEDLVSGQNNERAEWVILMKVEKNDNFLIFL